MDAHIQEFVSQLDALIQQAHKSGDKYAFIDPAYDLFDEIETIEHPFDFVEPIFLLLEKSPNIDFGGPGPIGSFLEKFYRNGYEDKLLQSLERKPTQYTVYLLSRCCNNSSDPNKEKYIALIRSYANSNFLNEEWRKIINEKYC